MRLQLQLYRPQTKYFEKRIYQHRTESKSHIHKDITSCHLYNDNIFENFGSDPTDNTKREYLKKKHFFILEKKLI